MAMVARAMAPEMFSHQQHPSSGSSIGSTSHNSSPALHGSLSSPATSSSTFDAGPNKPEVITGPDGGVIVVEHVVALHDFQSNNPTCLSFRAGQIIRVFNRDTSGWWDGELDGERGWFPSNYVDQDDEEGEEHPEGYQQAAAAAGDYSDDAASGSGSNSQTHGSGRLRSASVFATSSEGSSYTVLDPIYHAIALLHNAVRANRVAHFQPSTACVISSVRSVLSATDCLTRESPILKAHPNLARERKQILSVLSRLVTQARKASAPMADEGFRGQEMESMLRHAETVLSNVKAFLDVAVQSGVKVPDRRSSVYDDLYSGKEDARESDKTPTPDSARRVTAKGSMAARSMMDLRGSGRTNGLTQIDTSLATTAEPSREVETKPATMQRAQPPSADSPSNVSGTPIAVERTVTEVLHRLTIANDQLLSVIAAFIGHVHTHTRESHASSFAHLIDMTREAVDAVRGLLVVVEAVHSNDHLQATKPREMDILFETRESLYEATTALVTAARVITGSPNPALRHAEDDEKSNLLQAATGVLRTGGECVGAVKLCIDRHDKTLRITITEIVVQRRGPQMTDHEAEQDADGYEAKQRNKNTLSYLGRKATSLNCLRERYDEAQQDIAESDMEDNEGSVSATHNDDVTVKIPKSNSNVELNARERAGSLTANRLAVEQTSSGRARSASAATPAQRARALAAKGIRQDSGSDHHSDGSEAMSRDHSRTSGSSAISHHSTSTAETSARPSIDRRGSESDPFNIEAAVPHTAPMAGRFPRDGPPLPIKTGRSAGVASETNSPILSDIPSSGRSGTIDSSQFSDHSDQPKYMAPSYSPADISYNNDKQIIGATLSALVEKITPHDTTVDPTFAAAFAMCFRLFTTPSDLYEALMERYNLTLPEDVEVNDDERSQWEQRKVLPVRLRVVNFLRNWLEVHWQPPTDTVILDQLLHFAETQEQPALQRAASRLHDLAQRRRSAGSATKVQMMISTSRGPGSLTRVVSSEQAKKDGSLASLADLSAMYSPQSFPKSVAAPPTPIVSKGLFAQLRQMNHTIINVLDFDPLELARQLTVMESKLYCAILPEELLGQEFSKKVGVSNAVHVKAMSSLSTHLTGWISECILSEADARKRRDLLKFFIKLGDVSLLPTDV